MENGKVSIKELDEFILKCNKCNIFSSYYKQAKYGKLSDDQIE